MYVLSEIPEGNGLEIVFRMETTIKGYTAEELRQRASETWDRYVSKKEKTLRSSYDSGKG